jgi:hypothetical protein
VAEQRAAEAVEGGGGRARGVGRWVKAVADVGVEVAAGLHQLGVFVGDLDFEFVFHFHDEFDGI